MNYNFKDTTPHQNEPMADDNYYTDFTELDKSIEYSLTELSELIKTKGNGKAVRDIFSLAFKLIEQIDGIEDYHNEKYDEYYHQFTDVLKELSEDKDYYSLPEIAGARGGFGTLGERLNDTTTQLAQTEARISGIIVDGTPTEGNSMLLDGAISADGTDFGVIGDNIRKTQTGEAILPRAIKASKTDFLSRTKNLAGGTSWLDYTRITTAGNVNEGNSTGHMTSDFISIEPSRDITFSSDYNSYKAYYDSDKQFIPDSYELIGIALMKDGFSEVTPPNARYMRVSKGMLSTYYQVEYGTSKTEYMEQGFVIDDTKIKMNKSYHTAYLITDKPVEFTFELDGTTRTGNMKLRRNAQLISMGEGYNLFKDIPTGVNERDVPLSFSGGTMKILYDPSSDVFYDSVYASEYSDNHILVAVVRFTTANTEVVMNGNYTLDGKAPWDSAIEERASTVEEKIPIGLNARISNDLSDTINSWWVYPIVKSYKGIRNKTYMGFADSKGWTGVAEVNHETGRIVKHQLAKFRADDHNAAAVDVLPDGRIIAVYSHGHNEAPNLFCRISTNIESVEEFGPEITIPTNVSTTYVQLFQHADTLYAFYRSGFGWSVVTSSDNGLTWTETKTLVSSNIQYYVKLAKIEGESGMLRMLMYSNPNAGDTNIRLGYLDLDNFDVYNADGVTLEGNIESGPGLFYTRFTPVFENPTDKRQRLLDVAITPKNETVVAHAVYTDDTDVEYRISYYTDTVKGVSIKSNVGAFYIPSVYTGGITFKPDDPDCIYVSSKSGDQWVIEEMQTSNRDTFEVVNEINRSAPGLVAIRPFASENTLMYQEGYYNETNYTIYNTDLKYREIKEF